MHTLLKLLYWIPTAIFAVVFFTILLLFHPLQIVTRAISPNLHKKVVDLMMFCLNNALILVGNYISYHTDISKLPDDGPIIFVSNHQCMFDIPAIGWAFRKYYPKFISKKSLGKGIPSISYNLRHGGNTLISLRDGKQAILSIRDFGQRVYKQKYGAVIFPEGARARDGQMIDFKVAGLVTLLKAMPDAKVVPIALHNFWKFERWVMKPVPFGTHMQLHQLDIIDRDIPNKEIVTIAQQRIANKLDELNSYQDARTKKISFSDV